VDIVRGEQVEKALTALIERRSRKGDMDPDEGEELETLEGTDRMETP
jgi:hypothetical protein